MALRDLIRLLVATLFFAVAGCGDDSGVGSACEDTAGRDLGSIHAIPSGDRVAQSFQLKTSLVLSEVTVSMTSAALSQAILQVVTAGTDPNEGEVIGQLTLLTNLGQAALSEHKFTFLSPIELKAETTYFLVLSGDAAFDVKKGSNLFFPLGGSYWEETSGVWAEDDSQQIAFSLGGEVDCDTDLEFN